MQFELPPLPYPKDALEPHLGAETLDVHYEKHHRGYLKKLQKLIGTTPLAARSLEEIIAASEGAVFNNAAQVWNHTFYWRSLKPGGGGEPHGGLRISRTRSARSSASSSAWSRPAKPSSARAMCGSKPSPAAACSSVRPTTP